MTLYERTALKEIERSQGRDRGLSRAVGLGSSLVLGGLAAKVAPFLSEYLPLDLALKGINKVAPKLGAKLNEGQKLGLNIQEGISFLRKQFGQPEEDTQDQTNQVEPPQTNPLQEFETNYPDIARALMSTIQQGQPPQAAAEILKQSSSFSKDIKRLEKEIGKNFVDYILEIYGNQQQMAQQQAPQMQAQPQPQQMQPQQMATQEQGLDPQLLQIMNNIRQSIGQYKGG